MKPPAGDPNTDSVEKLWLRLLDNQTLSASERAQLANALAAEKDGPLHADAQMDALLRGTLRSAHDPHGFERAVLARLDANNDAHRFEAAVGARLDRQPRRFGWGSIGAFAAGIGLTALALGLRAPAERSAEPVSTAQEQPPSTTTPKTEAVSEPDIQSAAILNKAEGPVFKVVGAQIQPVTNGAAIARGDGLVTGSASSAVLQFADGTALRLAAQTVIAQIAGPGTPHGATVVLAAGALHADVKPQPIQRPFVLLTPHGSFTVIGTSLRLAVESQSSRIDVESGRVRIVPLGGRETADLEAGQYALVSNGQITTVAQATGQGTALLLVGPEPVRAADLAISARLTSLGFSVQRTGTQVAGTEQAALGARVVLISSTIAALDVDPWLRTLPVPIVTWESQIFDDLGMTESCEQGGCGEGHLESAKVTRPIVVKDITHPLAAGLSGSIRVASKGALSWGIPGLSASWIATVASAPTDAAIFAYERGTAMIGLNAPARRVALFMTNDMPTILTDDGWRLFDAAIAWATEGTPR